MPISSYSDGELLAALRHDDEKAFAELYERYWRQVHAMTYAMVLSMEETKEIVQNIFISLWNDRATLSTNHLPSYLQVATKNCVLNYIDSQLTLRKHRDCNQFVNQQAHFDHDVKVNELVEVRECRMNDLPKKSKNIFRLHELEALAEITRSLSALKRLFNIIPHNQQKG